MMKKTMILMLAMLILVSLTACGGEADPEQVITMAAQETEAAQMAQAASEPMEPFAFHVNGADLIPGQSFDPAWLPEAEAIYEVPSCAIEGMDVVYQYGDFEVTAVDDGTGAVVYSVYFLTPELATTEGLALGDSAEKADSLYGTGYVQENNARIYSGADTQLILILDGGSIGSIEYRWVP